MSEENSPKMPLDQQEVMHPSLRSVVVDRIRNSEPFVINPVFAGFGDVLIRYDALQRGLNKLCEEEGITDKTPILRFWDMDLAGKDYFNLEDEIYNASSQMEFPINRYERTLHRFSEELGVHFEEDDFKRVPEPHRYDYPPMRAFDRGRVIEMGTNLRANILAKDDGRYKRIIVIAQGGSMPEKRFNDYQVETLARVAKTAYPDAYVVVVTDNENIHDQSKPLIYRQQVNEVVGINDINVQGSYFYAMDKLVTTDSFNGWFGLGVRAMRGDRDGFIKPEDGIILYTAATRESYAVPGSTGLESKVLQHAKRENTLRDGLLNHGDYGRYSGIVYGSPSMFIHTYDLSLVVGEIYRQSQEGL